MNRLVLLVAALIASTAIAKPCPPHRLVRTWGPRATAADKAERLRHPLAVVWIDGDCQTKPVAALTAADLAGPAPALAPAQAATAYALAPAAPPAAAPSGVAVGYGLAGLGAGGLGAAGGPGGGSDVIGAPPISGGNPGNPGNPAHGAVPEPSTWALIIVGVGAIGAAARRRPALKKGR